jgi:hypothetical protein
LIDIDKEYEVHYNQHENDSIAQKFTCAKKEQENLKEIDIVSNNKDVYIDSNSDNSGKTGLFAEPFVSYRFQTINNGFGII